MAYLNENYQMVYDDPNLKVVESALDEHYGNMLPVYEENVDDEVQRETDNFIDEAEDFKRETQKFINENEFAYRHSNQDCHMAEMEKEIQFQNFHLGHLANENNMFRSNANSQQTAMENMAHENAYLTEQVNELNARLLESQRQQRVLKEQSDMPPRNGPDKDPMWAESEELHLYSVTPKTTDASKDIRNPKMGMDEVYKRVVPRNGTDPELSSFITAAPHWKLAAADGARRFNLTSKEMIVRKCASEVKPGMEHLFTQEIYKTPPNNGEQDEPIHNLHTGFAFPFLLTEYAEDEISFTRSIWDQVFALLRKDIPEEHIIQMDENGRRKFEPLAKIRYLRNL